MAGEIASAFVSIIPSFQGQGAALSRQLNADGTRAGDSAGKLAGSRFTGTFGTAIKGIGATIGAAFVLHKVSDFFGSMVDEATEAQKIGALTAAVIKSTGGAANVSAEQIETLAGRLSNLAGVDDEVIQGGANLLLTFKNVKNELGTGNDVFDQATAASLNLSVAMGKDLSSSALMVGKALNDPIAGLTALGRAGVQFSESQKDQIKGFVATGDLMSAQKIILGELESQFGGAAVAGATAGEKMSVAFANFKETLGTALLPTLQRVQTFIAQKVLPGALKMGSAISRTVGPAFKSLAGFVGDIVAEFGGFDGIVKGVGAAFGSLARFADDVIGSFGGFDGIAAALGAAFGTVGAALRIVVDLTQDAVGFFRDHSSAATVLKTIVVTLGAALVLYKGYLIAAATATKVVTAVTKVFTIAQAALTAVMSANPIALVVIAVAALAAGLIYAYQHSERFREIVDGAFRAVSAAAHFIFDPLVAFFRATWDTITSIFTLGSGGLSAVVSTALAIVQGIFGSTFRFITDLVSTSWNVIETITAVAFQAIEAVTRVIWGAISLFFTTTFNILKALFTGDTELLRTTVETAWNAIKNATTIVWDAIKLLVSLAWDGIKTVVSTALDTVKGWISSAWESVKTTTSEAWQGVKDAIVGKTGELILFVMGIPSRIVSALGNLGSLLYSAGAKVVGGLIDGINSMIDELVLAMARLAGIIIEFFPSSPVKRGPLRILNGGYAGGQITRMLADGMLAEQDLISKAAGTIAGAAQFDTGGSSFSPPKGTSGVRVGLGSSRGSSSTGSAGNSGSIQINLNNPVAKSDSEMLGQAQDLALALAR